MVRTVQQRQPLMREYAGRARGRARYLEEVDAAEITARFAQEIYGCEGHTPVSLYKNAGLTKPRESWAGERGEDFYRVK